MAGRGYVAAAAMARHKYAAVLAIRRYAAMARRHAAAADIDAVRQRADASATADVERLRPARCR